jgi:hypothetical protein
MGRGLCERVRSRGRVFPIPCLHLSPDLKLMTEAYGPRVGSVLKYTLLTSCERAGVVLIATSLPDPTLELKLMTEVYEPKVGSVVKYTLLIPCELLLQC